ncbi:hypothetical protein [Glycomyces arizonensis]|uniref:hypothetical protein n=1 Tax=Glycomyces arizonensis TaxID=256035 RepID=UPI000418314F|nr:hypothetical protein [Glycomyces arizonensis]
MRAWKDRTSLLRGRLHGRLFIVLGAVAAVAVAIAVWQFAAALGGGEDEALSDWTDPAPTTAMPRSPAEDTATAAPASASPSPTAEASSETPEATPSETAAAETSEAPETESAEPSGPSCTAALRLDSEGERSISVKVEVVNTGEEAIGGWEIVLGIDGVDVTGTWGMSRVEGDRYGNWWSNGTLDPGEDTVPSFSAATEGDPALPDTVPCTAAAE